MRKLELHWKILIGMLLGVLFGFLMLSIPWAKQIAAPAGDCSAAVTKGQQFVSHWIKPIGSIFIRLLKLIAIPLILASLIKGIADLKDISKLSKMGGRTILIYISTTLMAIIIGLSAVNIIQPGKGISEETIAQLESSYACNDKLNARLKEAKKQGKAAPLDFVVNIVPQNGFKAMTDNKMMLQVIFIALFLGVCLLLVKEEEAHPLKQFFDSLNSVVLKMVDVIMLMAPYAVFALLADVVVSSADASILFALLKYAMVVVIGLVCMLLFYLIIVAVYAKKSPLWFLKNISPAQLTAFSTSSSAATLPVTMECAEEHLGVDGEVASFVLPVGATINMDGTSLYQAVAAVFIAQALLFPLDFNAQIAIVITALMASIGSAGVPGAGMVMLVGVLEAVNFPEAKLAVGLALIFAVDRPLDMLRTMVNVTGDAMVSLVVAKSFGKLNEPNAKHWNDNLPLDKE